MNNTLLNYPTIPAGTLLLVGGTKIKYYSKAIPSMAPLIYNCNVFVQPKKKKKKDFIIYYLLVCIHVKIKSG